MVFLYEEKYAKAWDELVLNESLNGNFLQTRNFLNYHANDKFQDHSLMFFKGETLAAVMPANEIEHGKILLSHQGSTFGGLVIGEKFCSTSNYNWIFKEMLEHFEERGYERVELRMPHWLYARQDKRNELLDYYFQLHGFTSSAEVGFYIDLTELQEDYETQFESLKKRKLKKAYKQNLSFKEITSPEGVKEFHDVLTNNMIKFDTVPIHTYEDMIDFKNSRLKDVVSFYGVYHEEYLIAGSMVFNFGRKKVFHTQYLASRQECLEYCPNEFLYTNLIRTAKEQGFRFLSYGTATLEHGKVYNESLGMYKEGFNTDTYINRTYIFRKREDIDA